ncbi:endolytic transglycosylase MltG [Rhodoblastus sp.]|uniref:endolytic transglycosylase MltG n=1 Tax=Rhodoblastus sp. TaxID=1962975 RepID=UPI003F956908
MTDQPRGTEPAGAGRPPSARPGGSGASLHGAPAAPEGGRRGPPPPEKKRKASRLGMMSGFLSFVLAAAFLVGVGVVLADRAARAPGPLPADKVVYIQQGSDSDEIVDELQTQGVIDSPLLFRVALLVEGDRSRMKAGEYLFKQGASAQDVIDTMVSGKAILHAITIPEGLTSEEAVDRLRQDDLLAGDIREIPREGALLPETYKFHRGDRRDKLLQKMERDQKQMVDSIWRNRAPGSPLTSPYELVTLASIVEKETGKPGERPMVAAVFLNRLRKHMRLQSDPTIIYGLVGGKGSLGRPLTHADVESQTAYNTYVIDGLPPGPIANPGRAALAAVANPAPSDALYFVADGTGGHVFSDTLGAHNRNVQHLREIEQNNKPTAPGAPAVPEAPAGHDDHSELAPAQESGVAALPSKFIARALRLANLAGGHVLTGLLDAHKQDIRRWRGIERQYKAEAQLAPGAPAGRDSRSAKARMQAFGAPPGVSEFAARHDLAPQQPRLQPDSRMMARVSPLMPGAPPPPRRVTDFDPDRAGASASPHFAALGDVEMGGITRAENELDGPADEPAPDASPAQQAAAGDLDGPAEPVQTGRVGGALGYAGGLVNAAPNGKPRIFDAAAGTALDPLLEKNWDLDNAQTVDVPASEADAAKSQTAARSRTATRKTKAKVKAKVIAKAKAPAQPPLQAHAPN